MIDAMSNLDPVVSRIGELSIRDLVDLRAETVPEQVFVIDPDDGSATTYAELRGACSVLAEHIASHGVEPGDSVAYALENGKAATLAFLGILYGGYVAAAVNLVAGNDTIAFVLEHSETKLVLVQQKTAPLISEALALRTKTPDIWMIDAPSFHGFGNKEPGTGSLKQLTSGSAISPQSVGLLMYTSGTTGRPKGVMHTHASLLAGGAIAATAHGLTPGDRALCVLPLYHINGLCVTLMGPLVSGGSVVMPNRFSVSTFWDMIRENQCTWFSVVPTHVSYLLHAVEKNGRPDIPKSVRFGRSASAALSPDVQRAFEELFGLPMIETMGLTETAALILSNPLPPGIRKSGSPGIPVINEVIIADRDQLEVARGEEGEILVRGPNVMSYYFKNQEATYDNITADGWLKTGDLGWMDQDGYVFITGRLKELIIKGGENIAPREVDDALYSHPDVIEAAAFACECENYGQRIEAGVVLKADSNLSENDLIAHCQQRIGAFKAPDHIHFLGDLPKGPSGKIQRIKLASKVKQK